MAPINPFNPSNRAAEMQAVMANQQVSFRGTPQIQTPQGPEGLGAGRTAASPAAIKMGAAPAFNPTTTQPGTAAHSLAESRTRNTVGDNSPYRMMPTFASKQWNA